MSAPRLSAKQRAYIRRKTRVQAAGPDELDDELNIVPFLDIVVNLLLFLLVLLSTVGLYTQISTRLPSDGPGARPALGLHVFVDADHLRVTGNATMPAVCGQGSERGAVLMRTSNGQDWTGLRECLETLSSLFPNEDQLAIGAAERVEYGELVAAMDAVRTREDGRPLFREVRISAGIR